MSPKKRTKKKSVTQAPKQKSKTTKSVPTFQMEWNRSIFLILIALSSLTFFTYQGALDNDFVDWDDYAYVIDNNLVRSQNDMGSLTQYGKNNTVLLEPSPYTTRSSDIFKRPISLNFHPLTILTMRWNNNVCPSCFNGISARPFILWNIILHILNACLVFLLIYRLSYSNILVSVGVALFFAVHPMHVESVAWVSERKDVLYTFFFLLSCLTYIRYEQKPKALTYITLLVFFILSCLSKAMAVVLPLTLLLISYWLSDEKGFFAFIRKKVFNGPLLRPLIPLFAISLFFGLIAIQVQSGENFMGWFDIQSDTAKAINEFDTFSLWQRFQFASFGFFFYIFKLFIPTSLSTFYPYPTQEEYDSSFIYMVVPWLFFLVVGLSTYFSERFKLLFFSLAFYFVTIALVLQFVSVGVVIAADRYSYIPYIGVLFLIFYGLHRILPSSIQNYVLTGLLVLSIPLSILSKQQIETWSDSESLWTNVIENNTDQNGQIHANMEQALSVRGSFYGKMADFHTHKSPDKVKADQYLQKAFDDFTIAERLGTKRIAVFEGLGNTYGMRQEFDKALEYYSKALQIAPNNGTVYLNRGITYSILRDHPKAISDYSNAIQFAPSRSLIAYRNRGISYFELKRFNEAKQDFQIVLRSQPNDQLAKKYLKALGN